MWPRRQLRFVDSINCATAPTAASRPEQERWAPPRRATVTQTRTAIPASSASPTPAAVLRLSGQRVDARLSNRRLRAGGCWSSATPRRRLLRCCRARKRSISTMYPRSGVAYLTTVSNPSHRAFTPPRCSALNPILNVLPATGDGEKGVGDRNVFAVGEERLVGLAISFDELPGRPVVSLDCRVEGLACGHPPPSEHRRSTATIAGLVSAPQLSRQPAPVTGSTP